MNISTLIALALLLMAHHLKSQDAICSMSNSNQSSQFTIENPNLIDSFATNLSSVPVTVNVVFHIYNNSITFEKTNEMMDILNASFQGHNINFNRLCVNFNPTDYRLPYAINIYVRDIGNSAGYAGGYGSNYFHIDYAYATSSTLPHEMGHCLYLFHTHNEVGCPELVNGSNCNECGDYVCDTPADPKLYTNRYWVDSQNGCAYTGTFTDANGSIYNPDTHNFMSYAPSSCRNRFTLSQGQRMYNALQNLPILIPVTKPPKIQGDIVVCSSSQYSFLALPNSTITYSTSNPSGLSVNSSTGIATRVGNFRGQVNITANIVNPCGNASSILKSVWVGEPNPPADILKGSGVVAIGSTVPFSIHDLNNPNTGPVTYDWNVSGGYFAWIDAYAWTTITEPYLVLYAGVRNVCGSLGMISRGWNIDNPGGCPPGEICPVSIFPNPATDEVTISVEATDKQNTIIEVKLRDSNGTVVYNMREHADTKQVKIPVKDLIKGTYYLLIMRDGEISQRQIVVKH